MLHLHLKPTNGSHLRMKPGRARSCRASSSYPPLTLATPSKPYYLTLFISSNSKHHPIRAPVMLGLLPRTFLPHTCAVHSSLSAEASVQMLLGQRSFLTTVSKTAPIQHLFFLNLLFSH